jgi:hypothetical protein
LEISFRKAAERERAAASSRDRLCDDAREIRAGRALVNGMRPSRERREIVESCDGR